MCQQCKLRNIHFLFIELLKALSQSQSLESDMLNKHELPIFYLGVCVESVQGQIKENKSLKAIRNNFNDVNVMHILSLKSLV